MPRPANPSLSLSALVSALLPALAELADAALGRGEELAAGGDGADAGDGAGSGDGAGLGAGPLADAPAPAVVVLCADLAVLSFAALSFAPALFDVAPVLADPVLGVGLSLFFAAVPFEGSEALAVLSVPETGPGWVGPVDGPFWAAPFLADSAAGFGSPFCAVVPFAGSVALAPLPGDVVGAGAGVGDLASVPAFLAEPAAGWA